MLNGLMVFLAVCGIAVAFRLRNPSVSSVASVLLVFPLVYYVTYPLVRFRFAIEPALTILAVYGALSAQRWLLRSMLVRRADQIDLSVLV